MQILIKINLVNSFIWVSKSLLETAIFFVWKSNIRFLLCVNNERLNNHTIWNLYRLLLIWEVLEVKPNALLGSTGLLYTIRWRYIEWVRRRQISKHDITILNIKWCHLVSQIYQQASKAISTWLWPKSLMYLGLFIELISWSTLTTILDYVTLNLYDEFLGSQKNIFYMLIKRNTDFIMIKFNFLVM